MLAAETGYRSPPGFGCEICGCQPQPLSPVHLGRWPTEVPDPEYPGLVIVLCPRCTALDPAAVPAMIIRRRADRAVAWKRRQLSRRSARRVLTAEAAASMARCASSPSTRVR